MRKRHSVMAAAAAVLLATGACSVVDGIGGGDEPPQSMYTQAEAFVAMEAVAADMVAVLPDFPGFERRLWLDHPCSHDGVEDPDYVSVEIEYTFAEADAATPLVREEYVDLLKDHWVEQGYEVELDHAVEGDERTDRSLVVSSDENQLQITYRVAHKVPIMITSGCVPVSDPGELEYVPPLGGVEPGSKHDLVAEFFPEGIPAAEEQQ
ncbi:hypothetical protein AB0B28_03510 [Glycomyces sp. NPDC046736]|uniref:hypothetical protein n=1 Tax=Glycomyces sp. NPDC046736 TaxID=3155615 RepID=UPI0033DB9FA2